MVKVLMVKHYPSDEKEMEWVIQSINIDIKHTPISLLDTDGKNFYFEVPYPITSLMKEVLFDIAWEFGMFMEDKS